MSPAWKIIFNDLLPYIQERQSTMTDFAREIGLAPSTLLRPLNTPTYGDDPALRTVKLIYQRINKDVPVGLFQHLGSRPVPPAPPQPVVVEAVNDDHHVITIQIKVPKAA